MSAQSWMAPKRLLPVTIVLVFVLALLSPTDDRSDNGRLSTFSSTRSGARGVYNVLTKMGFTVTRKTTPYSDSLQTEAVHLILNPSIALSEAELIQLRAAVEQGAHVFIATRNDSVARTFAMNIARLGVPQAHLSSIQSYYVDIDWRLEKPTSAMQVIFSEIPILFNPVAVVRKVPNRADTTFLFYSERIFPDTSHARQIDAYGYPPIMLGATIGKGRVVFLSTPALLQNQVARYLLSPVALVDALEWLDARDRGIIIDEYHHGYGEHADPWKAIQRALLTTPLGRMALTGALAALIFLFSLSIRPIVPSSVTRIERRSVLEHADALAHAYMQNAQHNVGRSRSQTPPWQDARSLGLHRLLTGLRRRHPLGIPTNADHETYLRSVSAYYPDTAEDIERLIEATQSASNGITPDKLASLAQQIASVETVITYHRFPSTST